MFTTLLIWLFYLVGFLVTFGLLTVLAWWGRWVVICFYAMLPATLVVWVAWLIFALPINILFDGTAFEKKVVVISHWLNDATWHLFCFACLLPFKAIGLIIDMLYAIVH